MLVRDNSKQSWAQAKTLPLKDVSQKWVDALNAEAGFNKYKLIEA